MTLKEFDKPTMRAPEQMERVEPTAEQGSARWLFERAGSVTASRFEDVIGKQKNGKYYAARENYLWELVIERLTGNPGDHWTSAATQWGLDNEKPSAMAFEAATGVILEPCGFVKHPTIPLVGASPDAFIGEDGGYESKSPYNSANHLRTLLAAEIPAEHIAQCQGGMWITGRKYWEFQSFDPRFEGVLRRFHQRIERDDAYITMLAAEVTVFNDEVSARVREIKDKFK